MERTVLAAPQPSVGSGFTVTVPESEYQTLLAVTFRIVTSAVVATRYPHVAVTDGSGIALIDVAAGYGVTASSTADYCFAYGLAEWDTASTSNASGPIPAFPLREGDSIVLSVANIDAGDQVSRIRVSLMQEHVRP